MATVPLSGTNIRLLSGVPFSNDYKNTRWFDSLTDQTNYFLGKTVVHSMSQANFQRIDGFNFVAVDASIDDLWGVNYLMFQNASYNSKWFYAFVTKLEYKQRNTTYLHFEIDVFQTWKFDMTFKPSFVVREHQPMFYSDGSPIINTVDEGLNYGSEYRVVSAEQYRPCDGVYFMVCVAKKGMHGSVNGAYYASLNGVPQPLVYYIHPFMLNGSVPSTNLGTLGAIGDFLQAIYTDTNAVNNIVSLYVTDALPNNPSYSNSSLSFDSSNYQLATITGTTTNTVFVSDMTYGGWSYDAGGKHDGFTTQTESKLCMYPYRVIELVDFKGNKAVFKPEYIANSNIILSITASLGTQNKIAYTITDYCTTLTDDTLNNKVNLEKGLVSGDPQTVPILTDLLSAYLQGNWNSIQNQKNTIQFNGIMNSIGAGVGMVTAGATDNPIGFVNSLEGGIKGAGNSVLAMQGIQAKQKDISNTPPAMASMGSNSYFDYGNGLTGVWIIKKEIMGEYQTKLTDFFNMFGYKSNEVKVPNFHTRQNWNYVETKNCTITGNFNHEDLNELKSVFDNGVTLWHTDDVGNYDLGNGVI